MKLEDMNKLPPPCTALVKLSDTVGNKDGTIIKISDCRGNRAIIISNDGKVYERRSVEADGHLGAVEQSWDYGL